MREIKFRAWTIQLFADSVFKTEMVFPKLIENVTGWPLNVSGIAEDSLTLEGWNEAYIMQYVGVKDLNGKDIYEGDIVVGYPPSYRDKVKGVVEFHSMCFVFNGKTEKGEWWLDTISNKNILQAQVEVIGNIYENKDLIP